MPRLFLYGPLRHAPLLTVVAGRRVALAPARLAGHAVTSQQSGGRPRLVAAPGAGAPGKLTGDLPEEVANRIAFYAEGFGLRSETAEVTDVAGRNRSVRLFRDPDAPEDGEAWDYDAWVARWGALATAAAGEVMALRDTRPAAEIFARYPMILIRAQSALRAEPGGPTTLRRRAVPGDVEVHDWRQPYATFFALEDRELSFRRFDGSMSAPVSRTVFVSGDAATVLPYDPVRDRVLLVEQFRPGPFARGDGQPWVLEPVAGRIDAGETAEEAVRREAREEAGLELGDLVPVGGYYPSPAAKSEYLTSYIGLADLPDGLSGRLGGVEGEHEDIRTHVIGFDRLMTLIESGEAENAPLLISALFLARHRDRFRRA